LFRKFWQFYNAQVAGKTVAIWGAAFKSGSSSLKNSPIHVLLKAFWAQGVATKVYDPKAGQALNDIYHDEPLLSVVENAQDALPCADALLIVTNWKEFYSPDFNAMKNAMKRAVIFDGRNIYDPAIVKQCGIEYFGIGRK
jgi:UDPglucose 6-dehydrogenase